MEEKLEPLKRLDRGESVQKIADHYGVGRRTVGDWKMKRAEIEAWCSSRVDETSLKDRKTMKRS